MINKLIQLANDLDNRGLAKEASYLDGVIRKIAQIDPDIISGEEMLAEPHQHPLAPHSESRFSGMSPEERLINMLFAVKDIRSRFSGKEPQEIAEELGLGEDKEVVDLLKAIMSSELYG